jgi:predicted dehydrogenase
MDKIKAAIIGHGRIASLLEDDILREKPCTHAGAIAANEDFLLAAGADIDGDRRRRFAERWGVPVYADAAEMLKEEAPRVLVIATHPDSHERYCRLAAAHHVPLVICEKPLAGSLGAARRIARLSRNARGGPVIMVNHERRYSLDYVRAREIIAEGRPGSLLSVDATLYMGKESRLLDVLWHDGTHLADAIMFLTGMTMKRGKSWGAPLASRRGTAWLAGTLGSVGTPAKDKIPFVIELGAGRDHLVFEMSFSFERGRLRIGNGIFEVWESEPSPYA